MASEGQWGGATQNSPLRVKIEWQIGTNRCQTGFGLIAEGLEITDLTEPLADVVEWVQTHFRTLLMDTDTLLGVDIAHVEDKIGNSHSFSNVKGTISAGTNIVPAFLTVPVSFKSSRRAKYGQGRALWPVRSDGYIDGETINAAGQAAYTTVLNALSAAFVGDAATSDYKLINFHEALDAYTNDDTGYTRPAIPRMWYEVTSIRPNWTVSSVKSRKAGRGS